jgi:hypothetical protein
VRAVSIIVAGEPYLLDPEEAASLAWLLRTHKAPDAPHLETAALTAAAIVEDAARGTRAGTRRLTVEEERAAFTVLQQAAAIADLSPRLSRLHRALFSSSTARTAPPSRRIATPKTMPTGPAWARRLAPRRGTARLLENGRTPPKGSSEGLAKAG